MSYFFIFRKSLSLVVIAMLLSLPLVSITGDARFASAKVTRTEVAFTACDSGVGDFSMLKAESELSSAGGLSLPEELRLADDQQSSKLPPRPALPPQEIIAEVPIPPNIHS